MATGRTGYDLATGLGTPVASRVVGDLWGQYAPGGEQRCIRLNANTTLTVSAANGLLANDTDPMGEAAHRVASFTQPANGAVTVSQDGSFTYQPDQHFSGTDSFTYTFWNRHRRRQHRHGDHHGHPGRRPTWPRTRRPAGADRWWYRTQSGNTTTATTITTADTVYVDWAFVNQGNTAITTAFQTELLLDGTRSTPGPPTCR